MLSSGLDGLEQGWALTAAVAGAAAALFLLPPRRRAGRRAGAAVGRGGAGTTAAALAALGLVVAVTSAAWVVPAAILGGALLVGLRARERLRRTRSATRLRGQVLEACDGVVAELAAGIDPGTALRRVAREWDFLRPVAEAHDLGGDVPTALRSVAATAGAGDLGAVAAAWQVALRSGHGLAGAIGRVADGLRAAAATRRVVTSELASARATARLVALLPLVALLMGSGVGGDPWAFLLHHPVGWACLLAGLTLGGAGLWWIESIAADVERSA